jgi:hypothetical protein
MEEIDMEGFEEDEEQSEDSAEALIDEEQEKPVIKRTRIPVRQPIPQRKAIPAVQKKPENRYVAFSQSAREGLIDRYTNKAHESLWEVLAQILSDLDAIKRSVG